MHPRFTAVILAADRNPDDPLVRQAGVCSKALVQIDGKPMLQRVVAALQDAASIDHILVSGPERACLDSSPALQQLLEDEHIDWVKPETSPSTSAFRSMQQVAAATPVLITTADHPLLRADIVEHFIGEARRSGADVAVAMTTFASIREKFPKATKTVMRFHDGGYCGCNLFAFLTPQSRAVAEAWRRVEQQRKNPLRVISQLGWWSVLRYLLGRLSLEEALERLSKRLNVRIHAVMMPFPESSIDVDSIADQRLVEEITGTRK